MKLLLKGIVGVLVIFLSMVVISPCDASVRQGYRLTSSSVNVATDPLEMARTIANGMVFLCKRFVLDNVEDVATRRNWLAIINHAAEYSNGPKQLVARLKTFFIQEVEPRFPQAKITIKVLRAALDKIAGLIG